jgi:hypothetical protein
VAGASLGLAGSVLAGAPASAHVMRGDVEAPMPLGVDLTVSVWFGLPGRLASWGLGAASVIWDGLSQTGPALWSLGQNLVFAAA